MGLRKQKTINFTAVEILSGLLNKTKTQTIRKAWKVNHFKGMTLQEERMRKQGFDKKSAKFKVDEEVKLMWKGDMAYLNELCSRPREGVIANLEEVCFGTVKITEVFKIEMGKNDKRFHVVKYVSKQNFSKAVGWIKPYKYKLWIVELAKRDGFESVEDMFQWFDKKYNLSKAKEFWVYRWEWKLYINC